MFPVVLSVLESIYLRPSLSSSLLLSAIIQLLHAKWHKTKKEGREGEREEDREGGQKARKEGKRVVPSNQTKFHVEFPRRGRGEGSLRGSRCSELVGEARTISSP